MSTLRITIHNRYIPIQEILAQQEQERGLKPLVLEKAALLRRVRAGDWSGRYLGQAFLSAYQIGQSFEQGLGDLINLDAEGFRLFHEILHIRHVRGWRDDVYFDLAKEIKALLDREF